MLIQVVFLMKQTFFENLSSLKSCFSVNVCTGLSQESFFSFASKQAPS